MIPPLYIFDFDGVIADSLGVFEVCTFAACREGGWPHVSTRADFLRLFETNMYDGLHVAGVDPEDVPRLMALLAPKLEAQAGQCELFPGMADVLARLSDAGRVAVVTSNLTPVVAGILDRHKVAGVGDVLGADRGTGKVDKIARLRQESPDARCYYVGDTAGDMVEGRQAGAITVAVSWGWHPVSALAATNPDFIVHTPQELLARLAPSQS